MAGGNSADRRYPDQTPLARALAELHGTTPDHLLLAAGGDGVLDIVARSRRRGHAVILDPDFPRYREHLEHAAHDITAVPLRAPNFEFPFGELLSAIRPETQLVVLSSPGNPTGYVLPQYVVARLRERTDALIVLDEVYVAFGELDFSAQALHMCDVVSVRSFSKGPGRPGIRVGYLLGIPGTLAPMRRFASPAAIPGSSLTSAMRALENRQAWDHGVARQVAARRHLSAAFRARGLHVVEGANWVLANVGPAARAVHLALLSRGIEVHVPPSPILDGWLRVSTPSTSDVDALIAAFDNVLRAPFILVDGVLSLNHDGPRAEDFSAFSFACSLAGEPVLVDHVAVTVADESELAHQLERFVVQGGRVVEGPGRWPDDFCRGMFPEFPAKLAMRLATVAFPAGGLVVLAAPGAEGDQLDSFRRARGPAAVHHVAVKVDDIYAARGRWQTRGFSPLTPVPVDDGELAQDFLRNEAGQLIELIARRGAMGTFTCGNIDALRRAEVGR